ncbi:MAG: oligosaccharide flippase family protein, partial [Deltaproteobacteria bacterium]|nr:oligosaccharide flippase family protein [Deltaproteobacteria bacterium]
MSTRRFVRNSLLLISIEMLAKALGVVFFALVARFLGARELGLLAFATAVANFIVIPARFGFETVVQRDVGRNPAGTLAYFQGIGWLKGIISLAIMVIYVAALKIAANGEVTVMALVACFTLVYSFMEFINAFFRANQRPEMELAVRSFFSVSNLVLGIIVLYAGWRLAGVVSSQLLSVGLAVLLGACILLRIAPPARSHRDRQNLTKYLGAAAPFAGILVALYFSNQIGVIILTPMAGSEEVGYFAAAARLFDAMTLIPAAVMGAFLPMMSQLY